MRTKDEIIAAQTKLILELLRIGQEKFQEVTNLLYEIEVLPKDKIEEQLKITRPPGVVEIKDYLIKKQKICPGCKKNTRPVMKSGKLAPYCHPCNAEKTRRYRQGKTS